MTHTCRSRETKGRSGNHMEHTWGAHAKGGHVNGHSTGISADEGRTGTYAGEHRDSSLPSCAHTNDGVKLRNKRRGCFTCPLQNY